MAMDLNKIITNYNAFGSYFLGSSYIYTRFIIIATHRWTSVGIARINITEQGN